MAIKNQPDPRWSSELVGERGSRLKQRAENTKFDTSSSIPDNDPSIPVKRSRENKDPSELVMNP